MEDEGIWISDEDNAILQAAKEGAQGGIEIDASTTQGFDPVYLEGSVDAQLKDLRDDGDTANYENAREAAMKAALDRGDEAEFLRITEQHRPANQPKYQVPAAPGPTEAEVSNLQAIFENPAYQSEMMATDGSPEEMAKVYKKFKVPEEARYTIEDRTMPSVGAPLYGPAWRPANG